MPSVKNPNHASKNRMAARANKAKKQAQAASAAGKKSKIQKADARVGARTGLMPTSGPRAPLSKKKQKKVEQRLRLALQRKMKESGEVEMGDAPAVKETREATKEVEMDVE